MGNREVMVPLQNLHGLDFSFFGLSLGLCIALCFITLPAFVRLFNWFSVGIMVCLTL